MGDYEEAGTIYVEEFGETLLEDAGDCFALAKCWDKAISAYAKGTVPVNHHSAENQHQMMSSHPAPDLETNQMPMHIRLFLNGHNT
jgi:hypothetical protein